MGDHHDTLTGLTGPIDLTPADKPETFTLVKDYAVQLADGRQVWVPAGFLTDGLSIPRFAWWFISPWDKKSAPAAVIHDWLYHTGYLPRESADWYFNELLAAGGVEDWKRKLMYWAVDNFGKGPWEDNRRKNGKLPPYDPVYTLPK